MLQKEIMCNQPKTCFGFFKPYAFIIELRYTAYVYERGGAKEACT